MANIVVITFLPELCEAEVIMAFPSLVQEGLTALRHTALRSMLGRGLRKYRFHKTFILWKDGA